jgi:uncharacterized membrane protein
MMNDMNKRLLWKTFSWRIVSTIATLFIVLLITGTWSAALTITGIEFFAKMLIYYIHERIWLKIPDKHP